MLGNRLQASTSLTKSERTRRNQSRLHVSLVAVGAATTRSDHRGPMKGSCPEYQQGGRWSRAGARLIIVFWIGLAGLFGATTVVAQDLTELIRQLDAPEFSQREAATRELIDLGSEAIGPVAAVIKSGSREIRTRGIYVLKAIATKEEIDAPAPARAAIESLGNEASPFLQRRAAAVIAELNELRETKTLIYFQERGAVKEDRPVVAGMFVNQADAYGLSINEAWKGEPKDLTRLKYLTGMISLELSGEWVNDEMIKTISTVGQLRQLSIRKAKITNATPELLANHDNLEGFELRYCQVDDECLPALKRFQFLTRLMLVGTRITPGVARELEELFGTTVVDYRRGGFLGVSCITENSGCRVSRVVPESAADRIGIEVQDIIKKINDTEVATSEELIEAISEHEVSEEVEVTWLHGTELQTKKAVLGEYQDLDQ